MLLGGLSPNSLWVALQRAQNQGNGGGDRRVIRDGDVAEQFAAQLAHRR